MLFFFHFSVPFVTSHCPLSVSVFLNFVFFLFIILHMTFSVLLLLLLLLSGGQHFSVLFVLYILCYIQCKESRIFMFPLYKSLMLYLELIMMQVIVLLGP